MLLLGILAVPSVGPEALQPPHCLQHAGAGAHPVHSTAATHSRSGGSSAWAQGHGHDCPHCPASECARVSPCASSIVIAIPTREIDAFDPAGCRVALEMDAQRPSSDQPSPDTPPPQVTT